MKMHRLLTFLLASSLFGLLVLGAQTATAVEKDTGAPVAAPSDDEDTDEGIVADDEPVADEPIEEEGPDETGE